MAQAVPGGRSAIRNGPATGVVGLVEAAPGVTVPPNWLALLMPLALLVLTGCEETPESRAPMFVVMDSVGIEIVRNGEIGSLGDGLLRLSEDVRIGVADGPEPLQFHRINAIGVGADGTIYVGDNGSGEVRVFTAAGDFVRSIGGRGAGPGEFRRISSLFTSGEHLIVVDWQLLRATVFSYDGSTPETIPLETEMGRLLPLYRAPSGWVVSVQPSLTATIPQAGVSRVDTARIAWMDALPSEDQTQRVSQPAILDLARYPRVPLHGIGEAGGMVGQTRALWAAQPTHAVDGQGRVLVHNGHRYTIDVIDPQGGMVRRIQRSHTPVPIASGLRDEFAERVRTFHDTSSVDFPLGRALDLGRLDLPSPDVLPLLGRMLVSAEGELWVERPDQVRDPVQLEFRWDGPPDSVWDIFASSGEFMGTVELPGSFAPSAITGGQVIGVVRDELDVEYVVRYRVVEWNR